MEQHVEVTGYIGTHVANEFLKAGYVVEGTSRTASKAEAVKTYFDKTYGAGKFEIFEAGFFDDAVKGVEAMAHVASPVTWSVKDPFEDVINPAVKGTLNLLNSAHKYGKHVKHIVVTSSVASVFREDVGSGYVYSEADWNDEAIKIIQKQYDSGKPADGTPSYRSSKNEAKRAVWWFKEEQKPSFTLTTILPSTHPSPPETVKAVEATSTPFLVVNYYLCENKDPTYSIGSSSFHADKADGQRYMKSQDFYSNQQKVDVLRREFPDRQDIIVKGEPGKYPKPSVTVDGSKITRQLGLQYTDFETTILQIINKC
ncbi:hypothetical protein Unana1_02458 [Umbelopsis nana]